MKLRSVIRMRLLRSEDLGTNFSLIVRNIHQSLKESFQELLIPEMSYDSLTQVAEYRNPSRRD